MFLFNRIGVLVILCVLVSVSRAQEGEAARAPCDITVKETAPTTVNCSKRNIDHITEWPAQVQGINNEEHVLITFNNNSLTNITRLPSIPGSHIAINFKNNHIIDIASGAFSNLERIVYLDFSNNLLTGDVLRSEIFQGQFNDGGFGCIALESLYLGNNKIHSLDKDLFSHTPNLTRLYLNNNPLEILDHVTILALSSAVKLEALDLSYTGIDSIPYDAFKGLINLNQIDLSGNRFMTVPESLRLVGKTLEYLTFNNNPLVELNDDSFVELTNLKELVIGENEFLEEVKPSTFTPLKSLKTLHMCHNQNLRYISHNAFRKMKDRWTISEVYLDENDLSELSTDLMPWRKLDILGMTGNNWLCNCELADIITAQGAGEKFKKDKVPFCAAPLRLRGEYVTNITLTFCPTFDNTFDTRRGFTFSDLKPKHILWSIVGVALIVVLGMVLGLLVNAIKACHMKNMRSQPIHYINLNEDSSFA